MPSFDKTTHSATAKLLCRFIRSRWSRRHKSRLLQTCLASTIGVQHPPALKAFRGHIHMERWATWAFAIPELRRIERKLRLCWSKNAFALGGDKGGRETSDFIKEVDEAIGAAMFWARLVPIDALAELMRRTTAFCGPLPLPLEASAQH